MSQVIILAGSVQESSRYARQAILPRGRWIAPSSSRSIEGVVPSEIHILPKFAMRRDTHAIMAAVKRSSRRYQGIKWVYIDERGPLTERDLVVAHRYNAIFGTPDLDPTIGMAIASFTPEDLVAEEALGISQETLERIEIEKAEAQERENELQAAVEAKVPGAKPTKPRKPRAPKQSASPEIFD